MKKILFILLIVIIFSAVVVHAQTADKDGDGIKNSYDKCPNTESGATMPKIVKHLDYLGCSCVQIREDLFNKNECYEVICDQDRPLELVPKDPKYCIQTNDTYPDIIPNDTVVTTERTPDKLYDFILENQELKVFINNANREEFKKILNQTNSFAGLTNNVSQETINVAGTDTNVNRYKLIINPRKGYYLKDALIFEMFDKVIPKEEIIFSEEPYEYKVYNGTQSIAIWKLSEISGQKEIDYRINAVKNISSTTYVAAQFAVKTKYMSYLPIILIILVLAGAYFWIKGKIEKHRI